MLKMTDHGGVHEIRLDRPPANALNPELISLLLEQLKNCANSADAVVVSGRPGMFSAGLDIPALLQLNRIDMENFWGKFCELLHTITHMPVPTAFALTGHAPAGGIVLSLFGDYRIMCRGNYKTGLNEVQVGLTITPVIRNALVRLIGPHPAEKILVPGTMLSPDMALEIGLVDELEDDPEATVTRAVAWCRHLLSLPRNAMLMTRHLLREDLRACFADTNPSADLSFINLWFSESTQTALQAMVERLHKK